MNESIYNLVPREQYVPEKKPMYHSKNDMKASVPGSTFGKKRSYKDVYHESATAFLQYMLTIFSVSLFETGCFGTTRLYGAGQISKKDGALFGPPKEEYNLPRTISPKTRTLDKSNLSASGERFIYSDRRKDTVPSKSDRPIMGITTTKNFVTANAVEAILQGLPAYFYTSFVSIFNLFIF